jgi:hypothetical protein
MLPLFKLLRVSPLALLLASGCATSGGNTSAAQANASDYSAGSAKAGIPILIRAQRAADAVVEANSSGRPRTDLAELRDTACQGRRDQPVIFYQMVVSKYWHYYWLCSELNPRRASTRKGGQSLRRFVGALNRRAQTESASCSSDARQRLFSKKHESGIRANVYCDGKIVLTYPDGGRSERQYQRQRVASTARQRPSCPSCPSVPPCQPCRASTRECPACARCPAPKRCAAPRVCPPARRCPPARVCPPAKRCPKAKPCPPQKACAKADCRKYGKVAFGQGVRKACSAFCPKMYKRCRKVMGKQSAICHQMEGYCEKKCCANFCK